MRSLDFSSPSSVDIINNWVDEKTNSKIDKIIDNIDPMTMMFLINAIYFKGMWTYEFDKNMTSDEQFTKPDGSQVPCKMMKMTADLNYFADETVQIVDLPYGDGQFSMTVILPRSDQSIDAVAADLTPSQWTEWLSKLTKASGTVELPKFKLEYEKKLNDALTALGMGIAFSGQADFTRIDRKGGLYISKVKHKTFVEVDEEGTEAAAVTVVDIRLTSVGPSVEFYLRVDRPFIFAIRENHSQTILFIGKIVEPKL